MADYLPEDWEAPEPEVEIEAHGTPGTKGRFAAPLATPPDLFFAHDAFWMANPPRKTDLHAGFITDIELAEAGEVRIRVIAPAAYRLRVDDRELAVGPLRFVPCMPEYQECFIGLAAGWHRVSLHVHHESLTTRLASEMPAFVWADVAGPLAAKPHWWGKPLSEYLSSKVRISPLQGWMEWTKRPQMDVWHAENPPAMKSWREVVPVPHLDSFLGPACASPVQLPIWPTIVPQETGRGTFRDVFTGYRFDDPAVQFMVADPSPKPGDDPDGTWQRFALGRTRIGSLEFDIHSDAPGEATVAYAEKLGPDGRPMPVVPLSAGPTRMLQKFAFGPGLTPVRPLQAIGAEHLEIRLATKGKARVSDVRFRERDLLGDPVGKISLSDPLLERIWSVGLETMRASTEDSVVDPVRERGEWVGDIATAAIELLSVGWGNLSPVRRALVHAAAGARLDGMVAGCGPGELIYLGTYAAQWVTACLRCAELEGCPDLLKELEGPARRNIQALLACIGADGRHHLPWAFVDWGYRPGSEKVEVAVLAHVIAAVDSWVRWQNILGRNDLEPWMAEAQRLRAIVREALAKSPPAYHAAVLCERVGLVDTETAVAATLRQLRSSFPFDPNGQRLRDPTRASPDVATPYFTNYSLDLLLRAGKVEETFDLWRKGWGWMLEQGASTWWEVFDERWSRCHYWAGSPTWQMTRHILGMSPVLFGGRPAVQIAIHPGPLKHAAGSVPLPTVGVVSVEWKINGDSIEYRVVSPADWLLWKEGTPIPQKVGEVVIRLSSPDGGKSFIPCCGE